MGFSSQPRTRFHPLLELLETRLAPAVSALADSYVMPVNGSLIVPGGQEVLAQSGFNDARGINSDPQPNSPFQLGDSIHGRGGPEAGWRGGWFVSDGGCACGEHLGQAVTSPVYEGDGAVHVRLGLFRETWLHRAFEPQEDLFLLEQRIRLPANGVLASRPYGSEQGSAAFGPVWSAGNQFSVLQGDGRGGGTWINTGISVRPLQWHKVSLLVDVSQQTYEIFFDGVKYENVTPLRFRGRPSAILNVDYLADSEVWLDEVRIISLNRDVQWQTPRGVLHNDITSGDGPLKARLEGKGPKFGTLKFQEPALENGGFVYTPYPGFTGVDSFEYVAADGGVESNVGTVTIFVYSLPMLPVVENDEYAVAPGGTLVVGGGGAISSIAQSGFNDQWGMNANDLPNSPYRFGDTIHGRGGPEPGWAGAWRVSDGGCACGEHLGQAQNEFVWDGDGALNVQISQVFRETWISRQWAEPQVGQFWLEQRVRLPANGILGSRPYGNEPGLAAFGPVWSISGGRVFAHDGDGQGSTVPEDTGFRIEPLAWHQVTLFVDVPNQIFDFYFDGVRYPAPDPLNFRGRPSSIQWADYLFDSEGWIDSIRMIAAEAPAVEGILFNDISTNGPILSATLITGPSNGTLTFGSNGGFLYTPRAGFVGKDYFTYQASDGTYDSDLATVTIYVLDSGPRPGPGLDGYILTELEATLGDASQKRSDVSAKRR